MKLKAKEVHIAPLYSQHYNLSKNYPERETFDNIGYLYLVHTLKFINAFSGVFNNVKKKKRIREFSSQLATSHPEV